MKFDRTRYLAIGLITRPHGVRGELRLRLHHADSTALDEVDEVFLALPEAEGEPRRIGVEAVRYVAGGVLCELEGVADRTGADALRGAEVLVLRTAVTPPADDEMYLSDLEGCAVALRDGQPWGEVHEVQDLGAHAMLVIHDGDVERLLPFVPQFVVAVDLEARRVVVDPPEGLPEARRRSR